MEDKNTFETSWKKLEDIVTKLQKGDVELEEAYSLFEEGIKLTKECEEKLTRIEEKLAKILQNNELVDFHLDTESSNE